MEHVAIDLGGRESQICRRGSDGKIIEEKRVSTRALGAYLGRLPPSRVILETCAEGFGVADQALAKGHEVRVVPATLARSLGVGARGIKTDQRDARALSEASCRIELPTVHIPSTKARDWKSLCGMRESLVATRTRLINTVRGWSRRSATRIPPGDSERFPDRVRRMVEREALELPSFVKRQLVVIEALTLQIEEADAELEQMAKEEPVCRRLMTVPGIGPVNAILFTAIVDDIGRFPSASSVQSYLGLTPGEHSSSERTRRTSITKAGSPRMRRLLVQGAWCALRYRGNDPMVQWAIEVAKRRGKRVAVVALARKLAGILFALWRDGTTYDSSRGASPIVSSDGMEEALALVTKR